MRACVFWCFPFDPVFFSFGKGQVKTSCTCLFWGKKFENVPWPFMIFLCGSQTGDAGGLSNL